MILSMAASFSGVSGHNTTEVSERNHWSSSQVDNSLEAIIPNGTWTQSQLHSFILFWEITVVLSNDLV